MNEIIKQRIDEAAKKYAKQFEQVGYDDDQIDTIEEAIIYGAILSLQNQWISVYEALPKEDGWYLTLNINSTSPNFADTCQWNAKGKYWYTELCGDVFLHERTHWMQIPSLKGGEE